MTNNLKTYVEIEGGTVTYRKKNDKIEFLVIYRHNLDDYTLPKGHTEINEAVEDTATRETQEETGYSVEIKKPLTIFEYSVVEKKNGKEVKIIRRVYNFLAEASKKVGQNLDTGEGEIDIFWLSYEDAMKKVDYQNNKDSLKEALEEINRNNL